MPITNELKSINRLEEAGFTHDQAKAVVEVVEDGLNRGFDRFVEVLDQKLDLIRSDMREMESRLKLEIQTVRTEIATARSEVVKEQRDQMLRFVAIVTMIVAIFGAVFRFL